MLLYIIEVSNIVLSRSERRVQPLFAPSPTQSKTFGAYLSLNTRLNRFSAVFAYRVVLICRATPASHAPRLALTRELQMWRACSTSAPASNKSSFRGPPQKVIPCAFCGPSIKPQMPDVFYILKKNLNVSKPSNY